MIRAALAALAVLAGQVRLCAEDPPAPAERPNFLLITVDDMNCDSVGAFGCELEGTTPNLDRLAAAGVRFECAHVQVACCMPSRNVMWSGRYPHTSRVEGFRPLEQQDFPTLVDLMKEGGYFTAVRGKVRHSTPREPGGFDLVLDTADHDVRQRAAESYYSSARLGIEGARKAGKPFCVMINISDPHEPFYGVNRRGEPREDPDEPSRVFLAEEVPVPGFLFEHPDVREELARYFSSVRRADDCVGAVLRALEESGAEENTFVLFLSDHGMPLPFSKTSLYHHGTRTPLIVRDPGTTRPGAVDRRHMVSAIDLLPTILDVAGLAHPSGLQGRSLLPLLRGEEQEGRDRVFKEHNENSNGIRQPMRAVETRRYCYIFNPWSDGTTFFKSASTGNVTYMRMSRLARTNEEIAARLNLFHRRVLEELYDVERDPDCLRNLIDDPDHAEAADRLRGMLEEWMELTGDHALEPLRHRQDRAALDAYMKAQKSAASVKDDDRD